MRRSTHLDSKHDKSMTNRQKAICILEEETRPLPDGKPFTVRFYQPEDGLGIARLFYAIYGDGYPIDTYYIPEQIEEAHQKGTLRSAVARTDDGDVVSHVAFYRSSPPNSALFELGVGLTLPSYRSSLAYARCSELLMTLPGNSGINGFFGEAVCNHVITQKFCRYSGAVETALETALMPEKAYQHENSANGRVSCITSFKIAHDIQRHLFIPVPYHDEIGFLMEGLNIDRVIMKPEYVGFNTVSNIDVNRIATAGVTRCTIISPGHDISLKIGQIDNLCRTTGDSLLQCFIPLDESWGAEVTVLLRQQGFFLGGFLPSWFGGDGLLMQKLYCDPEFDQMKILPGRGEKIRDIVRSDWETSVR